MPWITEEQKKLAKEVDLLTYLQATEPNELIATGSNEYRTVTHGSLVISNGLWIWNRSQLGGRSALDYLIKVQGMSFVEAAEAILHSTTAWSGRMLLNEQTNKHGSAAASKKCMSSDQPHDMSFSLPVKIITKPKEKKKLFLPKSVSIPHKAVKYLRQRGIHS